MAKEIELKLKEGDKAPEISAATERAAEIVSLADYQLKRHKVLLKFTQST